MKQYEQFIIDWHYFLEDVTAQVKNISDEAKVKEKIMYLLTVFYVQPYDRTKDFYTQFYERLETAKTILG